MIDWLNPSDDVIEAKRVGYQERQAEVDELEAEVEHLRMASDNERYQRIEAAARAVCHYLGDEPDCCPSLSLEARIEQLGRVLDSEEP